MDNQKIDETENISCPDETSFSEYQIIDDDAGEDFSKINDDLAEANVSDSFVFEKTRDHREEELTKKEIDLYEDLVQAEEERNLEQSKQEEEFDELYKEVLLLRQCIIAQEAKINELTQENDNLKKNICSLYKTAKSEIDQKDLLLQEANEKLDRMTFYKNCKIPPSPKPDISSVEIPSSNDSHSKIKENLNNDNDQRKKIKCTESDSSDKNKKQNDSNSVERYPRSSSKNQNDNRHSSQKDHSSYRSSYDRRDYKSYNDERYQHNSTYSSSSNSYKYHKSRTSPFESVESSKQKNSYNSNAINRKCDHVNGGIMSPKQTLCENDTERDETLKTNEEKVVKNTGIVFDAKTSFEDKDLLKQKKSSDKNSVNDKSKVTNINFVKTSSPNSNLETISSHSIPNDINSFENHLSSICLDILPNDLKKYFQEYELHQVSSLQSFYNLKQSFVNYYLNSSKNSSKSDVTIYKKYSKSELPSNDNSLKSDETINMNSRLITEVRDERNSPDHEIASESSNINPKYANSDKEQFEKSKDKERSESSNIRDYKSDTKYYSKYKSRSVKSKRSISESSKSFKQKKSRY